MQQPQEPNVSAQTATQAPLDVNLTAFAHDVDNVEKRLVVVQDGMNESSEDDFPADSALPNELNVNLQELNSPREILVTAREAVDVERQHYHDLFEFGPHGYLITDRSGVILKVNRAACELLGIPNANLVGKPLPIYVPAQIRQDFRKLLLSLEPQFDAFEWEGQMRRRPGAVFDVALMASSACDPKAGLDGNSDHSIIGWMMRDVTSIRRQEEIRKAQTRALITTLNALGPEHDLNTFLGRVLRVVGEQLGATRVALWYYERVRNQWTFGLLQEIRNVAGEDPAHSRRLPAHEWRLWYELVQERRAVMVENLAADPRISDQTDDYPRIGSLLLTPMLLGDEVLGMLRIHCAAERSYDDVTLQFAQTLAQQATLAVQSARLVEGERQRLVLHECNRMAQGIYAIAAQGFADVLIQLDAVEDALNVDSQLVRDHIVRAREQARRSLSEARRSVYALRPELLESQDLPGAIERIVDEIKAGTGLTIQFQIDGRPQPLPADIEDHLLGAAREALTNVLKHAEAQQVEVTVSYDDAAVNLVIRDDGRGILSSGTRFGGTGLIGMRKRTIRLGGRFQLDSAPGEGTRITVAVPIV